MALELEERRTTATARGP